MGGTRRGSEGPGRLRTCAPRLALARGPAPGKGGGRGHTAPVNRTSTREDRHSKHFLKRPERDLAGGLRSRRHFSGRGPVLEIILIARLGAYGEHSTLWP